MAFRDEFPVLESIAYLNAGTDGPLPRAAIERAQRRARRAAGRGAAVRALHAPLRAAGPAARGLRAAAGLRAPRTSRSRAGRARARARCSPGWTSARATRSSPPTPEHPGLLGPLIAARQRGATVRAVPFAELANAVARDDDAGRRLARELGHAASSRPPSWPRCGVPVILDGAQGAGAVPVDVAGARLRRLRRPPARSGCAAPTAPGCSTCDPEFGERVRTVAPDATSRSRTPPRASTRRCKASARALRHRRCRARWWRSPPAALERARGRGLRRRSSSAPPTLADRFAARLARGGPHGRARAATRTLVAVRGRGPRGHARAARRARASASATCPGTPYLRASVGAWNDESDLERLLDALL